MLTLGLYHNTDYMVIFIRDISVTMGYHLFGRI